MSTARVTNGVQMPRGITCVDTTFLELDKPNDGATVEQNGEQVVFDLVVHIDKQSRVFVAVRDVAHLDQVLSVEDRRGYLFALCSSRLFRVSDELGSYVVFDLSRARVPINFMARGGELRLYVLFDLLEVVHGSLN